MSQVILEGVRGTGIKGDIAIDDISLTPGCRLLTGPLPAASSTSTATQSTGQLSLLLQYYHTILYDMLLLYCCAIPCSLINTDDVDRTKHNLPTVSFILFPLPFI